MKVLIWFGGFFFVSMFVTVLGNFGIYLGGLPTFLLYLGAFFVIKKLCKLWDEKKANDEPSSETISADTENNEGG